MWINLMLALMNLSLAAANVRAAVNGRPMAIAAVVASVLAACMLSFTAGYVCSKKG